MFLLDNLNYKRSVSEVYLLIHNNESSNVESYLC
jgi:hypothetical protein